MAFFHIIYFMFEALQKLCSVICFCYLPYYYFPPIAHDYVCLPTRRIPMGRAHGLRMFPIPNNKAELVLNWDIVLRGAGGGGLRVWVCVMCVGENMVPICHLLNSTLPQFSNLFDLSQKILWFFYAVIYDNISLKLIIFLLITIIINLNVYFFVKCFCSYHKSPIIFIVSKRFFEWFRIVFGILHLCSMRPRQCKISLSLFIICKNI